MKTSVTTLILTAASLMAHASEPWTVERCMQYAVEHNHSITIQRFALDDSKTERTRAIGSFLPTVSGSIGAQTNYGRAIDPETNTYTNISTFYNSYSLTAALTVFDGLQRYNDLRTTKANILMNRHGLQAEKDDTALKVYKAFMDLAYCQGAAEMTSQKCDESRQLLHQTKVMAEVGQKSDADVAQMEATLASDEYELTHMESLTIKARLTLKQLMNYPVEDSLAISYTLTDDAYASAEQPAAICSYAENNNPRILQALSSVDAARHSLRSSYGALLPTLSVGAGVSTSFYRNMDNSNYTAFSSQFHNNAGEYIYAAISIPLFNRLSTISSIRKNRTALRRAEENLCYERTELQRIITEAIADVENSMKETTKMQRKVESDSIASRLTTRKYEEGLASSIDVKTAAVTLLQSRASLLQSQLTLMYNKQLLNYYKVGSINFHLKGQSSLWTDK